MAWPEVTKSTRLFCFVKVLLCHLQSFTRKLVVQCWVDLKSATRFQRNFNQPGGKYDDLLKHVTKMQQFSDSLIIWMGKVAADTRIPLENSLPFRKLEKRRCMWGATQKQVLHLIMPFEILSQYPLSAKVLDYNRCKVKRALNQCCNDEEWMKSHPLAPH